LLFAVAWLLFTALLARQELNNVKAGLPRLRTLISDGKVDLAQSQARDVSKSAHRAHTLTTGPAWYLTASIPILGEPFNTVRGLTASADDLGSTALPTLIRIADDVNPRTLRTAGDRIDIDRLVKTSAPLHSATQDSARTTSEVARLPRNTWLPAADRARSTLLEQLTTLNGTLKGADHAAQILPAMLGKDGPKRYFIGLQNEAESRGTGGLPGAFAILVADQGKVTFSSFQSDIVLYDLQTGLNFGADYNHRYAGADSTNYYGNSNVSPHFPYAAQIWAAMWQKKSGQHIDGAIAVDPTALSYLLAVTGPAHLADGTAVTAGNIVDLTQSAAYAQFSTDKARKPYLLDVARAVEKHLLAGGGDTKSLVEAAGRAAGERRVLVWSADPAVEQKLADTSVAGIVPDTAAPYSGLVVANAAGNKLDYYLDRSVHYESAGCGANRTATVTIKLTNNAPASGLPSIVTGRLDFPHHPTQVGDNKLLVSYYATRGATMTSISLDGTATGAAPQRENGHPVFTLGVESPRGATRTLVLKLREPAGPGAPTILRQPLVRPLDVSVTDSACK
jgi:hypothetical protein